jgi:hypothetical protein
LTITLRGDIISVWSGAVSSVVRALASHARGRRFKSSTAHFLATKSVVTKILDFQLRAYHEMVFDSANRAHTDGLPDSRL